MTFVNEMGGVQEKHFTECEKNMNKSKQFIHSGGERTIKRRCAMMPGVKKVS